MKLGSASSSYPGFGEHHRCSARGGFRATRLASTGGFRREGNTTIMMGVEDDDIEPVLAILRSGVQTAASRKAAAAAPPPAEGQGAVGARYLYCP